MSESFLSDRVVLHQGDAREVLRAMPDASVDSVVCDPPYALVSIGKRFGKAGAAPAKHGRDGLYARAAAGFMGQQWDTGETAFAVEFWAEVLRVLKPGGHLVAFSGTRTYHRMVVAIEDAGFEIRDQLAWVYGSGFPKSHDVSKAIDKAEGHWRGRSGAILESTVGQVAKGTEYERTDKGAPVTAAAAWEGWGTALKPAWEPIVFARKPLDGSVAANVLEHGTGALNIDGCRVATDDVLRVGAGLMPVRHVPEIPRGRSGEVSADRRYRNAGAVDFAALPGPRGGSESGRWPANIVHDGSPEVVAAFPAAPGQGGGISGGAPSSLISNVYGDRARVPSANPRSDTGSAARFFYSAKADAHDRVASQHPTVKPVDLMQWLCQLITPPGGVVLDPFAGSGTTGEAAWREGFRAILIEREAKYCDDIRRRLRLADRPAERSAVAKAKGKVSEDHGPLFGGSTPPWPEGARPQDLRPVRRSGRAIGPIGLKR